MHVCRTFSFCLTAILTIGSFADAQQPEFGTRIVVTTTDGRSIDGIFSSESNEQEWMLINAGDGLSATTVIPVGNILRLSYPDETRSLPTESTECTSTRNIAVAERTTVQAQWIETTARILNVDNDPQPDGIELRVTGFSQSGIPVPLNGSIDASLVGLRQKRIDTPPRLRQVDRWSRKITNQDRQASEVVFYLPLHVDPAGDFRLFDWAQIKVRLNTPGKGALDAVAEIPLRNFSPFQDQRNIHRARWSLSYGGTRP